jgi:hypothetical protein
MDTYDQSRSTLGSLVSFLPALTLRSSFPVLLFKQTEQPVVYKGNIAASTASALQALGLVAILILSGRDQKRRAARQEEVPETPYETPGTPEDIERKSLH